MPSEAYIALTIKVTDPGDGAERLAQQVTAALSTLLNNGGQTGVSVRVRDSTELGALARLTMYLEDN